MVSVGNIDATRLMEAIMGKINFKIFKILCKLIDDNAEQLGELMADNIIKQLVDVKTLKN